MDKTLKRWFTGRYGGLAKALIVSNAVSLILFFIRVVGTENFRFWFLFWNLLLAWVPLAIAALLVKNLSSKRWLSWQNMLLSVLWLVFLPNSFYIVSDLIHVHLTGEINILFDVVLFFSCIFNGYVFGFMSLYFVHRELIKRLKAKQAHMVVGGVIVTSSYAIYLGRYLRWNTWDIIVHPIGVLFDVTDRFINPAAHPQFITTTLIFSLLLGSMYYVLWQVTKVLQSRP